jgi:hypothetical protein
MAQPAGSPRLDQYTALISRPTLYVYVGADCRGAGYVGVGASESLAYWVGRNLID